MLKLKDTRTGGKGFLRRLASQNTIVKYYVTEIDGALGTKLRND